MRDNVGNGPRRRKRFRGRAERPIAWGTPVCRSTARGYIEGRKRAEGWPSGLRRTLGKRVYGKPYRGFESHSLRQNNVRRRSPLSRIARFFRHFLALHVCTHPPLFAIIPQVHAGNFVGLGGRFSMAEDRREPSAQPTNRRESMTQKLNRLTARKVATATEPGLYADGGGLYLRVGRGGAKSWCLRYMLEGKAREMGLGGLLKVSLADARRK